MNKDAHIPEIGLIGLSHKTAPVEVRELFTLGAGDLPVFFENACAGGIHEVVYLTTCNRMEIYFTAGDLNAAMEALTAVLEGAASLPKERFEPHLYKKYSRDAVLHLLSVASSLDSMVVGENEIFFQVKNCYRQSVDQKRTGPVLNKLFHHAFKTAKRVRTETEISRNPLSIAYIATELARKIFEDLSKHRALLIGAGEMGELILKYFTKYRVADITLANRSLHNAERIAREINRNARILPLEEIGDAAAEADIIIASVSSPHYIITADMIRPILKKRGGRPLFIIDIAVPRNIDPEIAKISNVFLYNIDDLKSIADSNLKNRLKEVELARSLIESDAEEFFAWYEGLAVVPAIMKIQNKFEEIRTGELARYRRRKLKHLSDDDFTAVEELTRQIMTKTLHNPIDYLKRYQGGGHAGKRSVKDTAKLIEELFKE